MQAPSKFPAGRMLLVLLVTAFALMVAGYHVGKRLAHAECAADPACRAGSAHALSAAPGAAVRLAAAPSYTPNTSA